MRRPGIDGYPAAREAADFSNDVQPNDRSADAPGRCAHNADLKRRQPARIGAASGWSRRSFPVIAARPIIAGAVSDEACPRTPARWGHPTYRRSVVAALRRHPPQAADDRSVTARCGRPITPEHPAFGPRADRPELPVKRAPSEAEWSASRRPWRFPDALRGAQQLLARPEKLRGYRRSTPTRTTSSRCLRAASRRSPNEVAMASSSSGKRWPERSRVTLIVE